MKKLIFIALICIIATWLFADGTPRVYSQMLFNETTTDGQLPDVINGATSTATNYHLTAWIVGRETEVLSTNPILDTDTENGDLASPPAIVRIWRLGNGTTLPYTSVATINIGEFLTPWAAGEVLHCQIDYLGDLTGYQPIATSFWEMTIPTGTAAINWSSETLSQIPIPSVPPYLAQVTEWDITVTSTPAGAAIWLDGADTGFITPYIFTYEEGFSGVFSVVMENYTWVPETYPVTDLMADLTINFEGHTVPMAPVYVAPPNGALDLDYAGQTLVWASGDREGGMRSRRADRDPATGYMVYFGTDNPPMTMVADQPGLTWPTGPLAPNTMYYWQIVAYNAIGETPPGPVWSFETMDVPFNYYDITVTSDPAGAAIWLDGADTGFVTPYTWFDVMEGFDGLFSVVLPYYDWMPLDYQLTDLAMDTTIHFVGTCQTYTVYVTSSPVGAEIFVNGVSTGLYTTGAPGTPVVLCMPGPYTITLGPVDDGGTMYYFQPLTATTDGQTLDFEGTVPVELSSFAATVTSEMFVNLKWVTESETNALGFNIYRSTVNNSAGATKVNLSVVPATNTSLQHTYNYVDDSEGLAPNNTYYYWLESVDLSDASDLHGPVNVTITGNVTPILPEISVLNNAYPNPFRMGETATIKVNIKAGETGTVTIYNLLGQAVKTYKVGEGSHTLTWNANGNASGIYFYKLSTPSTNVTKKLVIVN